MAYSAQLALNVTGLSLTMIGGCLLFLYSNPKKQIGHIQMDGDNLYVLPNLRGHGEPTKAQERQFTAFHQRATFLNRFGFALITVGALAQMIALMVQ